MRLPRERGVQTYDLNNWGSGTAAQFKRGFRPVEKTWAKPRSKVLRPMTTRLVVGVEKYGSKTIRKVFRRGARGR